MSDGSLPGPTGSRSALDCFICSAAVGQTVESRWYDEPVWGSDSAVAIAGIGALVRGYVLIAPRRHVPGTIGTDLQWSTDFRRSATTFIDHMSDLYGDCTVFEHGGTSDSGRPTSACVDHAHIHVIPGKYDLGQAELEVLASSTSLEGLASAAPGVTKPYLMYRDPGSPYFLAGDVGVPQFFRRHIAKALGREAEWDYAAAPKFDLVRETIRDLRGS